jgi:hypothetical protein
MVIRHMILHGLAFALVVNGYLLFMGLGGGSHGGRRWPSAWAVRGVQGDRSDGPLAARSGFRPAVKVRKDPAVRTRRDPRNQRARPSV